MGTLMILSILLPSLFAPFKSKTGFGFTTKVRKGIQKLFAQRSFGGLFLIGLLNGLLPCGLVYVAIASSIGTGDLYLGIGFMVLFGLGTLPMMLGISMLGNIITMPVRNKIQKVIPFVVVIIGIIFILRGLSLGIPYLSPPKNKMNPEFHMQKNGSSIPEIQGACCHEKKDTATLKGTIPDVEGACCHSEKNDTKN